MSAQFAEDDRSVDLDELIEELSACGDSDGVHPEELMFQDTCSRLTPASVRLRATVKQLDSNSVRTETQALLSGGDVETKLGFTENYNHKTTEFRKTSAGPCTIKVSILLALLFRIILLLFSVWQDQTRWPDGQLRFTDVDYDVFTDAARAMVVGKDVYEARPTYRYSPLIAAVVAPGHWLFQGSVVPDSNDVTPNSAETSILPRIFGKIVFILADLVCAWLQYEIVVIENEIHAAREPAGSDSVVRVKQLAVLFITLGWLFNPVTAVVSVRGNAEAVLGVCVLSCLLLVLKRRVFLAGLVFGLCVHLKLYPVIYAPAIYLWLGNRPQRCKQSFGTRVRQLLPSWSHVKFGLATLVSFVGVTGVCYAWFGGMRFLHQAYFYHFIRSDIKHNFAPHFYPLYLLSGFKWKAQEMSSVTAAMLTSATRDYGVAEGLISRLRATLGRFGYGDSDIRAGTFSWVYQQAASNIEFLSKTFNLLTLLPSIILIPGLSFKLRQHLGLSWFAVTYAFVTFNKVCTSQYFLWFLVLLPVALPSLKLPSSISPYYAVAESILMWFGAQSFWLASAYTLEMRNPPSEFVARYTWLLVWVASISFFFINVVLLRRLIRWKKTRTCSESSADAVESVAEDSKKAQ